MPVPRIKPKNSNGSEIQKTLRKQDGKLTNRALYRERCRLESSVWQPQSSFRDVSRTLELQANLVMAYADSDQDWTDKDQKRFERFVKAASTIAYISAVQITTLKMAKSEYSSSEQLDSELRKDKINLSMTPEQLKELCGSTSTNVQIAILNEAVKQPKEIIHQELMQKQEPIEEIPGILTAALRNATNLANEEAGFITDIETCESSE